MTRCLNCGDPARYVLDGDESQDGALCATCAADEGAGQQTLTTSSNLSLDAFGGGA